MSSRNAEVTGGDELQHHRHHTEEVRLNIILSTCRVLDATSVGGSHGSISKVTPQQGVTFELGVEPDGPTHRDEF
jgi:hypothetical protein